VGGGVRRIRGAVAGRPRGEVVHHLVLAGERVQVHRCIAGFGDAGRNFNQSPHVPFMTRRSAAENSVRGG